MAQPARKLEAPPVDPTAVERAYRLERARRRARAERERDRRLAGLRFAGAMLALLGVSLFLLLATWKTVEQLFGL